MVSVTVVTVVTLLVLHHVSQQDTIGFSGRSPVENQRSF